MSEVNQATWVRIENTKADGKNVAILWLDAPGKPVNTNSPQMLAAIEDAWRLRISNWVQKDAAKFLGISSRVMNYKVAKYEIKNTRWSKNKLVG